MLNALRSPLRYYTFTMGKNFTGCWLMAIALEGLEGSNSHSLSERME